MPKFIVLEKIYSFSNKKKKRAEKYYRVCQLWWVSSLLWVTIIQQHYQMLQWAFVNICWRKVWRPVWQRNQWKQRRENRRCLWSWAFQRLQLNDFGFKVLGNLFFFFFSWSHFLRAAHFWPNIIVWFGYKMCIRLTRWQCIHRNLLLGSDFSR